MIRALAFVGLLLSGTATQALEVDEEGLFHQPWIPRLENLQKAREEATVQGKILTVLWERKGCSWCRRLHEEHFSNPAIVARLKRDFMVVQGNMKSTRLVVGLDGAQRAEREIASGYRIFATPTLQYFMPLGAVQNTKAGSAPMDHEITRSVGFQEAKIFMQMLEFVSSGAWEKTFFALWLRRQNN